jgi:hypothetical protein
MTSIFLRLAELTFTFPTLVIFCMIGPCTNIVDQVDLVIVILACGPGFN